VPNEKKVGALGDLAGDEGGSRRLDHGADCHVDPLGGVAAVGRDGGDRLFDPRAGQCELFTRDGEGDHDLHDRVTAGRSSVEGRFHERPYLHGVEARLEHAEADAPCAEHRVHLLPGAGGLVEALLLLGEALGRLLDGERLHVGEELVQRGVEQAHDDRQTVHRFQDLDEVGPLGYPESLEGGGFFVLGRGEDHAPDDRKAVLSEKHVLGPAQPDPLRTESAPIGGVRAVVGVGSHSEVPGPDLVRHSRIFSSSSGGSAAVRGTAPTTTVPVDPSIEMISPARTTVSPTRKLRSPC